MVTFVIANWKLVHFSESFNSFISSFKLFKIKNFLPSKRKYPIVVDYNKNYKIRIFL